MKSQMSFQVPVPMKVTVLAALITVAFSATTFAQVVTLDGAQNELAPDTEQGVTITSNSDGTNSEGIQLIDNNITVFYANQSQSTQTTLVQSADDVIINSDSDAGGAGEILLQKNGITLMSVDAGATSINTPLTVTGTITGNLSGNATTATTATTAGSATYATTAGSVDAGNLTGSTLASGVTASSLTSVGTLSSLTVSGTSNLTGIDNTGGNITNAGAISGATGIVNTGNVGTTTLSTTGAATIGTTLGVTGTISGTGGISLENFSVADGTGNTLVGGTLAVTGATTLSGATQINNAFGVTGLSTLMLPPKNGLHS